MQQATQTPTALLMEWESKVKLTPSGLQPVIAETLSLAGLTQQDRLDILYQLELMDNTSQWAKADIGMDAKRLQHGDKGKAYSEIAGRMNCSPETLQGWISVAEAWPISERWDELSIYHHAALTKCSREHRIELMTTAVNEKLSAYKLRELRDKKYPQYKPSFPRPNAGDKAHELAMREAELDREREELRQQKEQFELEVSKINSTTTVFSNQPKGQQNGTQNPEDLLNSNALKSCIKLVRFYLVSLQAPEDAMSAFDDLVKALSSRD